MTPKRIRPFPWRSLAATTLAEVGALHDVKRWTASHLRIDALVSTLGDILGAKVDVRVTRAQPLKGVGTINDAVGVLIARADAPDALRGALVEAEGALAANVVARVLKRPVAQLVNAASAPSAGIAGAIAAVLLAAARRTHSGIAMRVLAAGPAAELEGDLARLDPELLAVSLTVLVGDDAFAARVVVSRTAALCSACPPWNVQSLAALGSTPLGLPIVACATLVTAAELAMLRPGDAFVALPGAGWPLTRTGNGALVGPVWLASPSSDAGLRARLCEDGRLVLGAGIESLLATEALMNSDEKDAVAAALGDVPIVVRVEIGEALMAARDWASLGRGDVVALGRRVGEPVLLRVGGVPLARGELVEIDGEVAVRIIDRVVGERTAQ